MSDTVIAAFFGILTAVITSLFATWVSFRSIRAEYKSKYHLELISRQINACEILWKALATASRSLGEERLMTYTDEGVTVSVRNAKKLYDDLVLIFNAESGLYFSKNLRGHLFILRDFLDKEIISTHKSSSLRWSRSKANMLDGYVQNLRQSIRQEVGLENLKISEDSHPE